MFQVQQKLMKKCSQDRQTYWNLLKWATSQRDRTIGKIIDQNMLTKQRRQQSMKIVLSCMNEFYCLVSKECHQKGSIIKFLMEQVIQIINSLRSDLETQTRKNISRYLKKAQNTNAQYDNRIQEIQNQLLILKKDKQNKWKTMFMLIKDNRVLKRQNAKLIKSLKQEYIKVQKTEKQLHQMTNQYDKLKILFPTKQESEGQNLLKFIQNKLKLTKVQKSIKNYPTTSKRKLLLILKQLQIKQINELGNKIQYIMKVMEDSGQIYDDYIDLNDDDDLQNRKFYNISVQTQLETTQTAVNTILEKKIFTNSYTHTQKPKLFLLSNCFQFKLFLQHLNNHKVKNKNDFSSRLTLTRTIMPKFFKGTNPHKQSNRQNPLLSSTSSQSYRNGGEQISPKNKSVRKKSEKNAKNCYIISKIYQLKIKRSNDQSAKHLASDKTRRSISNQIQNKESQIFSLKNKNKNNIIQKNQHQILPQQKRQLNKKFFSIYHSLNIEINLRSAKQQKHVDSINVQNYIISVKNDINNKEQKKQSNQIIQFTNSVQFSNLTIEQNEQTSNQTIIDLPQNNLTVQNKQRPTYNKTIINRGLSQENKKHKQLKKVNNRISINEKVGDSFSLIPLNKNRLSINSRQNLQNKKNIKDQQKILSQVKRNRTEVNQQVQISLLNKNTQNFNSKNKVIQPTHSSKGKIPKDKRNFRGNQLDNFMKKIIKSIYIRRNQLLSSEFVFQQFLDSQFKCIYGNNEMLTTFIDSLNQIRQQKSTSFCFQILLSVNLPRKFLQDLFRLYILMIDKNGNSEIFLAQKSKAQSIFNYLLSIYYCPQHLEEISKNLPFLNQQFIDLNQGFATLANSLKLHSIQSQLNHFINAIIPFSQQYITFDQIKEIMTLFKDSQNYYDHLLKLKMLSMNKIPIHRLSLYALYHKFQNLLNIESYIDRVYSQWVGAFVEQETIKFCLSNSSEKITWIYFLTQKMINNLYRCKVAVNRTLLKFCRLAQLSIQISKNFPFSQTLLTIQNSYFRASVSKEFNSIRN